MRIITGRYKGRRLVAPAGRTVRPTSDGLRETLFNVLGESVEGARVLDAYAGTGALGLEALSRGAAQAVFVERDPKALRALAENVRVCGAEDACAIIRGEFERARALEPAFDLLLLDPPYDVDDLPTIVERAARLAAPDARIVLEHSRRRTAPETAGAFRRVRLLRAGDSALSIYEASHP
jgi:16S rRNA (guanine966-N2)-methyltransferase